MKKVLTAGIGGRSFIIEEDAYRELDSYLSAFRTKIENEQGSADVMADLEQRIAELFQETMAPGSEIVTSAMVASVISRLGMPDGGPYEKDFSGMGEGYGKVSDVKKYFRDPDSSRIAGVCGGLSAYFSIDALLIRIIFLVLLCCGSVGFWVYIILWLLAPVAKTPAQKCQMRGLAETPGNLRRFMK